METVRTFKSVGLLKDLVGKGKNIATTKENLAKPLDVCVKLGLKDSKTGKQYEGFVSLPLSQALKKRQISLGALLNYPLSIDNTGKYSIHNEQSELIWHDTAKLSVVDLVKVEITDDELIVF